MAEAEIADSRQDIRDLSIEELEEALKDLENSKHLALQAYKWIWQRGELSFEQLPTISKRSRRLMEQRFRVGTLSLVSEHCSEDGTIKYIWGCRDGSQIESVLIPDGKRLTLCISSQVGCAMACTFCLTGDLGLIRQLSAGEIASQPLQVSQRLAGGRRITNLVMMGMGEPLHNLPALTRALKILLDDHALNFSHRKVTVSTVGLAPKLEELSAALPVNLAISLNASTDAQRSQVMPVNRRYDLQTLIQTCRELTLPPGKRITFEYVMMAGFNDSLEDAQRVLELLHDVPAKVNLIPYNENPQRSIRRPSDAQVKRFQDYLVQRGLSCSVRASRGRDVSAACGQLGKGPAGGAAQ